MLRQKLSAISKSLIFLSLLNNTEDNVVERCHTNKAAHVKVTLFVVKQDMGYRSWDL